MGGKAKMAGEQHIEDPADVLAGLERPGSDALMRQPATTFRFDQLRRAWDRFDADFSVIVDDLLAPEITQLLDVADDYPQYDVHPFLPVFPCSFPTKVVRQFTDEHNKRKTNAPVIHVKQGELSVDLAKFEARIHIALRDTKKAIVFLDDASLWTNKVHVTQSRLLNFMAALRRRCPGLVVVLNFKNWPVDDYFVEPKESDTMSHGFFHQHMKWASVDYVMKREFNHRYEIDAKEFARQVVERMVAEPSFNISLATADWLYKRALTGKIEESLYDCFSVFMRAESQRKYSVKTRTKTTSKQKGGKQAQDKDASVGETAADVTVCPIAGPITATLNIAMKTCANHAAMFAKCKNHAIENDMEKLEKIFDLVLERSPLVDREPYQLHSQIFNAICKDEMPELKLLKEKWQQLTEKDNNRAALTKWYTEAVRGSQYKKFNPCLRKSNEVFTVDCTSRVSREADIGLFEKMAATMGDSMMGDVGRLYRWFEQNGRKLIVPTTNFKKPQSSKFAVPEFELSMPRVSPQVLTQKCMGLINESKGNGALSEKQHFGRVWLATAQKMQRSENWRQTPVENVESCDPADGQATNKRRKISNADAAEPTHDSREKDSARVVEYLSQLAEANPAESPLPLKSVVSRDDIKGPPGRSNALRGLNMSKQGLGAEKVNVVYGNQPVRQAPAARAAGPQHQKPMKRSRGITNIHW